MIESRLEEHLSSNTLHGPAQSTYRAGHSTERALLRVHHDISSALDNNSFAVLLMLDLSVAFDVIDHNILQSRLEYVFGISGSALKWLLSYLRDRIHGIAVGSTHSNVFRLKCGVPQGLSYIVSFLSQSSKLQTS